MKDDINNNDCLSKHNQNRIKHLLFVDFQEYLSKTNHNCLSKSISDARMMDHMGNFRFEEMVRPCIRDSMSCYIETSYLALYAPANDGARTPRYPMLPHGLAHVWGGKAEPSFLCSFLFFFHCNTNSGFQ